MSLKSHKNIQKTNTQELGANNRRRFLKQGGLATAFAAVASTIGLTPFSPVHAASTEGQSSVEIKPLAGAKAQKYIQATLASQDYQKFEQAVKQNYAGTLAITKTEAVAIEVVSQGKTLIVVRIPLNGGANESFYAATLLPDTATLLSTISGLYTFTSQGNIRTIISRDGHVAFEGVLSPDSSTIIQGTLYTLNTPKAVQGPIQEALPNLSFNPSCFDQCMKQFGVTASRAGIALGICGITCTFGIPTCIACIAAILGVGVAAIGTCIASCS